MKELLCHFHLEMVSLVDGIERDRSRVAPFGARKLTGILNFVGPREGWMGRRCMGHRYMWNFQHLVSTQHRRITTIILIKTEVTDFEILL